MIQVKNIKLSPDSSEESLRKKVCRLLKIADGDIRTFSIVRKSIDARKKDDVHFVYTVNVSLNTAEKRTLSKSGCKNAALFTEPTAYTVAGKSFFLSPVVIGAGPAGLFAALSLAQAGANPILLERGEDVDSRVKRVNEFWSGGEFDASSNVQFGEGGAGTFSDGKLTTGTNDPRNRHVLETFVSCGAPPEILYLHKPHIGTDKLVNTVRELRKRIQSLGGKVFFRRTAERIRTESGRVTGVQFRDYDGNSGIINTNHVVLAVGHSARDVFSWLSESGADLEAKPFSVGVRIEHLQSFINLSQYGEKFAAHPNLPVADYKLSCHMPDGRGIYTFCMCPGGVVVAAASEEGGVVTNGMSRYARDEKNANSALLVGVSPDDFGRTPMSGVMFQRKLEQAAFIAGGRNYRAPAQTVDSFERNISSKQFGVVVPSYKPGVKPSNLRELFPEFVNNALLYGLKEFDKRIHGFAAPDAVMTGVETRTSSPVRILRDKTLQSNLRGLYPCGEGAGYAGGIMSAAVDGLRVAEAILESEL